MKITILKSELFLFSYILILAEFPSKILYEFIGEKVSPNIKSYLKSFEINNPLINPNVSMAILKYELYFFKYISFIIISCFVSKSKYIIFFSLLGIIFSDIE